LESNCAVAGIQAALLQVARSGKGAFIDISLSEAATWLLTCGINPLSDRPFILPATRDRRLYVCGDGRFVAVARRSIVESAGVPVPANPVRISDPDASYSETVTAAPHTVGQDTADVLASAGFSAKEIEDCVSAGLV
jgi:crotonobetainyl-CoA:carnitine CoA-transferase CaiB-like acyl-CoA transferase